MFIVYWFFSDAAWLGFWTTFRRTATFAFARRVIRRKIIDEDILLKLHGSSVKYATNLLLQTGWRITPFSFTESVLGEISGTVFCASSRLIWGLIYVVAILPSSVEAFDSKSLLAYLSARASLSWTVAERWLLPDTVQTKKACFLISRTINTLRGTDLRSVTKVSAICMARVPRGENPSGVAWYVILVTIKEEYRIGSSRTKFWSYLAIRGSKRVEEII